MRNDTPRTFLGSTTFTVTGMTSPDSEQAVTSAISGIDGVGAVTVDLASGAVTVSAVKPVDRVDIASAVATAGYTLVG